MRYFAIFSTPDLLLTKVAYQEMLRLSSADKNRLVELINAIDDELKQRC